MKRSRLLIIVALGYLGCCGCGAPAAGTAGAEPGTDRAALAEVVRDPAAAGGLELAKLDANEPALPPAEFTWHNPVSRGSTLLALFGERRDDLYAVGEAGAIVHFDGTRWSRQPSGTKETLWGGWSRGEIAFVVGEEGTILRRDGSRWQRLRSRTDSWLTSVWGAAPDDVFAVGSEGTVLHFDGRRWKKQPTPTEELLKSVWGSGPRDVFAVGRGGTLLHYDGKRWSAQQGPKIHGYYAVWGRGPRDVFAVGTGKTVVHYDGRSWSPIDPPVPTKGDRAFPGLEPHTGSAVKAITGAGPKQLVLLSGAGGTLLQGDGKIWTRQLLPFHPRAIWASAPDDVFGVGSGGTIRHWDGRGWSRLSGGVSAGLGGVWGTAANDVYAVGDGGTLLHYDGSRWSSEQSGTEHHLRSAWGSGPNDIFVVGGRVVLHYDGHRWSSEEVDAELRAVWGASSKKVFAVGDRGAILHFDGAHWTAIKPLVKADLRSVWGSSENDVYAVGRERILHYDGRSWSALEVKGWLKAIWGSGADDIYAAGHRVMHFDGRSWTRLAVPGDDLQSVWGFGPTDVYAAGDDGQVLHFNGSCWIELRSGTDARLDSLWGCGRDLFAVGATGTVVHRRGAPPSQAADCATRGIGPKKPLPKFAPVCVSGLRSWAAAESWARSFRSDWPWFIREWETPKERRFVQLEARARTAAAGELRVYRQREDTARRGEGFERRFLFARTSQGFGGCLIDEQSNRSFGAVPPAKVVPGTLTADRDWLRYEGRGDYPAGAGSFFRIQTFCRFIGRQLGCAAVRIEQRGNFVVSRQGRDYEVQAVQPRGAAIEITHDGKRRTIELEAEHARWEGFFGSDGTPVGRPQQ